MPIRKRNLCEVLAHSRSQASSFVRVLKGLAARGMQGTVLVHVGKRSHGDLLATEPADTGHRESIHPLGSQNCRAFRANFSWKPVAFEACFQNGETYTHFLTGLAKKQVQTAYLPLNWSSKKFHSPQTERVSSQHEAQRVMRTACHML